MKQQLERSERDEASSRTNNERVIRFTKHFHAEKDRNDRRTQAEREAARQVDQERAQAAARMMEQRRMDVQEWTELKNFESDGGIPPTKTSA